MGLFLQRKFNGDDIDDYSYEKIDHDFFLFI